MVEMLTDIGAMVAIKETRGVSGEDLVVSDKAWELSRCLYDLRNNTENNVDAAVSTGVIIQEFDKVGVSSWGELDARRNMGGLDNKDQEDLWVDMVDAVCICTFMKYGDDKDFIKAVKRARKRDEYSPSDLEKDFFGGLEELDGVGELITDIFPTNKELRQQLRLLSGVAKRGGLGEKIISDAMGKICDIEGANEEHKAMILVYLQELGEGIRSSNEQERMRVAEQGRDLTIEDTIDSFDGINTSMRRREIPTSKEDQLRDIRQILEMVEAVKGPIETNPTLRSIVDSMEQRLGMYMPEVAREAKARLSIHFCAQLMRQANGVLESKGGMTMGQAAFTAEYFGREPDSDVLIFLFDSDSNGLKFEDAWNMVERACFEGQGSYMETLQEMAESEDVVKRMKEVFPEFSIEKLFDNLETYLDNDPSLGEVQKVKKVYCTDSGYRKEWVRYYLAMKLARKNNNFGIEDDAVAIRHAIKTIQIAENAQLSFGETNVANAHGQVGVDDLAELIGFMAFKQGKIPRTPAGSPYIYDLVKTIPNATGWLRAKLKGFGNNRPLLVEDMKNHVGKNGKKEGKPWETVAFGDYSFHNMVTLTKINRFVREYLLSSEIKPGMITTTMLRDVADLANRCEKPNDIVIVPPKARLGEEPLYYVVIDGDNNTRFVELDSGIRCKVYGEKAHVKIDGVDRPVKAGSFVEIIEKDKNGEEIVKRYFIKTDTDNNGRKVRYVEYRRGDEFIRSNIAVEVPDHVIINGEKYPVVNGMNGPTRLRVRFLQAVVDMATSEEALGWTDASIKELGRIVRRPLWPGLCPFITPMAWREDIFTNKELNIARRMHVLNQIRLGVARSSQRYAGPIR